MRRLRVAIATAGRFHVLDLAKELSALGHDVVFYSAVSRARLRKFGFQGRAVSLLPSVAPLLALQRAAPKLASYWVGDHIHHALDRAVARRLEPCDVLIAMSGIFLSALDRAKAMGAQVWLERASIHILEQAEMLASAPAHSRPSADVISREIAGYAVADRISVPSSLVAESFRRDPAAARKLFVNPYGVDIDSFVSAPTSPHPAALLFVGTWCFRKGVDVLSAAIEGTGTTLTHAGSVGDVPSPHAGWFRTLGHLDQAGLPGVYQKAATLVLPSREDGFGVVITQALACGLRVICSDKTGGKDLKLLSPVFSERIAIVPAGNVEALREAIVAASALPPLPPLSRAERRALSWRSYAERYAAALDAEEAATR